MKKCVKCGKEMADDSRFCPRCGEDQATISALDDNSISSINSGINVSLSGDFVEKLNKAALVGVGLTALSVLMPMLRVIGFMEFTIMDYSKFLALVIIGICVYMGHEIFQKNYAVPTVVSQGLLVYFIVVYFRYSGYVSEVRRGFSGMGRDIIYVEWGTYVFIIGVILTCFASIMASIVSSNKSICKENLMEQWKLYTLGSLKFHTVVIPGYAWLIVLAVVLIVITTQANPFRGL